MPEGIARAGRSVAATLLVATAALAAAAAGCAGPGGETRLAPVAPPAGMARLRVRVRRDSAPLDQEVGAALETELARAGIAIAIDDRTPADLDVKVALDLRSVGPVVEGIATASVERGGMLVDRVATGLDVYRRDRFAALTARQLAEALAASPRIAALAPLSGAAPAAPATSPPVAAQPAPPPVAAQPAPPSAAAPPPPSSAVGGPEPLGRSGRFGWGLGLELQVGWAQAFAPGGSPAGVHLALAVQADMGPRAAFRLPFAFVGADSGENQFAEIAVVPTFIYRFRERTDQSFVPYLGLGVALEFVDAGRTLLGRPLTGMRSPDSCSSRGSPSPVRDCGFAISPAPTVGVEWQGSRLFTLDLAAAYSFAHLTASTGLVSWVHVLTVYVGPRLSF